MNINPYNSSNNNISMRGWCSNIKNRAVQKCLNMMKERTFKDSEKKLNKMKKIDEITSNPMWNRGIIGATALITQPAIDYYNHRVDDETRTVSRNRTISKILAGTLVGMFVVRGPVYKAVEKFTNLDGTKKYSKALIPKEVVEEIKNHPEFLSNYRKTIAMFLALVAMIFTNYYLDAPLTMYFTNKLNQKSNITNNDKEVNEKGVKYV